MKCYVCKRKVRPLIKTLHVITYKADWICNDCIPETDEAYEKLVKELENVKRR